MSDAPTPVGISTSGPDDDPTKNVLDVVNAAIARQDDLRFAQAELFHKLLDGLKLYIDTTVEGHDALTDARFDGIAHEFELIENRRQEQKIDTKTAVDAALSAAEKAVREQAAASEKSIIKSETAAAEQSRQNAQTFTASLKGVTDTLADTKDRVGKIESQAQGRTENRVDHRSNVGMVVGVVGGIIGFLMFIMAVVVAVLRGTGP